MPKFKRLGKNQILLHLVKEFDADGRPREDVSEYRREQRVLARVMQSKMLAVVSHRQWKMSTGTVAVALTLEAVEMANSVCEACGEARSLNDNGHCRKCAAMARKDHGGLKRRRR